MTEFFPEIEATILTNANHAINTLGTRDRLDLICTGGEYESRSRSYVGTLAEEAVQRYYLQWLFIGVDGLDPVRGASEVNPGQARLKERLLSMAENVCVLVDHTKLDRKCPFFFAKLHHINTLITDSATTEEQLKPYRQQGISVHIATPLP